MMPSGSCNPPRMWKNNYCHTRRARMRTANIAACVRRPELAPLLRLLLPLEKLGLLTKTQAIRLSTEIPRSSNNRRIASSMRLFGHDAPAVIPTVIFPAGNQSRVSTSSCLCWS
jgi:hypothetical protein